MMQKKYVLFDLLGVIVIIAALLIEKVFISYSLFECVKEIFKIRLSSWYSFFFILYYVILHCIRYHNAEDLDESGMYHVERYYDGILESENDEYRRVTGVLMGINYMIFNLILILFNNSILGFLITYISIIFRDFIVCCTENNKNNGITGIILSSTIWLIIFIIIMFNNFENGLYFNNLYYNGILPGVCFWVYVFYCSYMCASAYSNENLSLLYIVFLYIQPIATVICLLINLM